MAKVLVLYSSGSGNTEKMALFVYKGAKSLPGMSVRLRSIDEASGEDLKWCDGIAVGAPTNFGGIPWKMKKWWDEQQPLWPDVDGKIACAFSSSGSWGGGAELNCMAILTVLMNFGFLCFGLTDYTGPKFSAHYGAVIAGEPQTDGEREACVRLGLRLAEWCAVYVDGRGECHPLKQSYDRLPATPAPVTPIVDYAAELAQAKAAE